MNIKKLELNPKWGLNFGSFKPQSAIDMAKQAGWDRSGRVKWVAGQTGYFKWVKKGFGSIGLWVGLTCIFHIIFIYIYIYIYKGGRDTALEAKAQLYHKGGRDTALEAKAQLYSDNITVQ